MARIVSRLGESMIASTDSLGAALGTPVIGAADNALGIQTPAELTNPCWLEATVDPERIEWRRVQSFGLDVALPPNRHIVVDAIPAAAYRAVSEAAEISDRSFVFWTILSI